MISTVLRARRIVHSLCWDRFQRRYLCTQPHNTRDSCPDPVSKEKDSNYYLEKRKLQLEKFAIRSAKLKVKAKEKQKEKRKAHYSWFSQLSPEEQEFHKQTIFERNKLSDRRLEDAKTHGIKVCIDLSFEIEHTLAGVKSLATQVAGAHAFNKHAVVPVNLHVTSLTPNSQIAHVANTMGFHRWNFTNITEKAPWEVFNRDDIIILSPNAKEPLDDVSLDKVYVVCGIVDRYIKSNISSMFAAKHDLKARRLPLQENMDTYQKLVFNVDTVVKILATYHETKNWKSAIMAHAALRHMKVYPHMMAKTQPPCEESADPRERI